MTASKSKVVRNLVVHVVQEKLFTDTPSDRTEQSFLKYLRNTQTIDIVYETLIEIVQRKIHDKLILTRCLSLLKKHLFSYAPSPDTLLLLDRFCQNLANENEAFIKSLKYIRAVINSIVKPVKSIKGAPLAIEIHQNSVPMKENLNTPPAIQVEPQLPLNKSLTDNSQLIVKNFLLQRIEKYRKQSLLPLTPTQPPLFPSLNPPLFHDETGPYLKMQDTSLIRNRIETVGLAKKKEENILYKESGQLTVRRKAVQLFQYKCYMAQQILELTDEEQETVLEFVVNPPLNDYESCLMASKILIKILLDCYCRKDFDTPRRLLLQVETATLASESVEVQLHGFNLLFNLSVHATLMDDDFVTESAESQRQRHYNLVQEHLFQLLKDSLRLLLKDSDATTYDEKVWLAALNCLLFFISKQGRIDKEKLLSLDVGLLPAFITNLCYTSSCPDESMFRKLVELLMTSLYREEGNLNVEHLKRSCGISYIVGLYLRSTSIEASSNLFLVIFDYLFNSSNISHSSSSIPTSTSSSTSSSSSSIPTSSSSSQLESIDFEIDIMTGIRGGPKKSVSTTDQRALLLEAVERTGLHLSYRSLLKSVPKGLGKKLQELFAPLHPEPVLTRRFLCALKRFTLRFGTPDAEYKDDIDSLIGPESFFESTVTPPLRSPSASPSPSPSPSPINHLFDPHFQLRRLLFTLNPNGELWLFELLKAKYSRHETENTKKLLDIIDSLLPEMVASSDPRVRRTYIFIAEKLFYFFLASDTIQGEHLSRQEKENRGLSVFNSFLLALIAKKEKNDMNLIAMFDVVVNSLIFYNVSKGKENVPNNEQQQDSLWTLFLEGKGSVSWTRLERIDLQVYLYLFTNMPIRHKGRVVLLLFIIHLCRRDPTILERSVEISFFRGLLVNRDPEIAYHASSFLLDQMQTENPDKYKQIISSLLVTAQQTGNYQLLDNSYLQIKALIGGVTGTTPPTPSFSTPSAPNSSRRIKF